jgi:hypothetical protein
MRFLAFLTFFILLSFCGFVNAQVTQTVTFNVKWTDNSNNEDGFNLYRCTGANCSNWTKVQVIGPNNTEIADIVSGDSGGILYRYHMTAFNKTGESGRSNIAEITSPLIIPVPNVPTGVVVVITGMSIP